MLNHRFDGIANSLFYYLFLSQHICTRIKSGVDRITLRNSERVKAAIMSTCIMGSQVPSKEGMEEDYQKLQFPWKLHRLLDEAEVKGHSTVISWMPGGRSFQVFSKSKFADEVMPRYFDSSKFKSFQRSLNLWGFQTIQKGPNKGQCHHRFFIRGHAKLCSLMQRIKIKGATRTKELQQVAPVSQTSPFSPVNQIPMWMNSPTNGYPTGSTKTLDLTGAANLALLHSFPQEQQATSPVLMVPIQTGVLPNQTHQSALLQAIVVRKQRQLAERFLAEVAALIPR